MSADTTADPRIWYQARDGKVYDPETGKEYATAATANGRDLERHADALETAKKQRAAIDRASRLAPVLVRPAGSHHLEMETHRTSSAEPFTKEELWPILELEAPRVGLVRVSMSADRYVANYPDGDRMGPWRITLRDIRKPDEERPDVPHLGAIAAGVGPATRDAIGRACEPIVAAWLETDDYRASRRRAGARAVARLIDAPPDYKTSTAREALARAAGELDELAAQRLEVAINHLETGRGLVDQATADA